jgi:hypothetical protein
MGIINQYWSDFKLTVLENFLDYEYSNKNGAYDIRSYMGQTMYRCLIYTGTAPADNNYSQKQNDLDKTNFETLYKNFYTKINLNLSNMITVSLRFYKLQEIANYKYVSIQYIEYPESYMVFGFDGNIVYRCVVYKIPHPVFDGYTTEEMSTDYTSFMSNKIFYNKNIVPLSTTGVMRVATEKPTNSKFTFSSHNFCDKTTWYTNSVRVVSEVPSTTDYTTYTLSHQFIIDMYHGKITREDDIKDKDNNSYRVSITVDSVAKTEQDPHYGTGGDYIVNYAGGTITFLSALTSGNVVNVTYNYATDSVYTIKPPSTDYDLGIDSIDLQCSTDMIITDSIMYQCFALVDYAAPQMVGTGEGQVPSRTMIPINAAVKYKGFIDYMNDTNASYPNYPAIGGSGWRGANFAIQTYVLNYSSAEVVPTILNPEIRMWLEHDTPFSGTFVSATFFCQQMNRSLGMS